MTDNEQIPDPEHNRNRLPEGYDRMLDRVGEALRNLEQRAIPQLAEALEEARDKAIELGELTSDEAGYVMDFLRRDLDHAGEYLAKSGRRISDWLAFDLDLIEAELLDKFSIAADRTRVEWLELAQDLDSPVWNSGEVAGPGTLCCEQCGTQVEVRAPKLLDDCEQCGCERYRRLSGRQWDEVSED